MYAEGSLTNVTGVKHSTNSDTKSFAGRGSFAMYLFPFPCVLDIECFLFLGIVDCKRRAKSTRQSWDSAPFVKTKGLICNTTYFAHVTPTHSIDSKTLAVHHSPFAPIFRSRWFLPHRNLTTSKRSHHGMGYKKIAEKLGATKHTVKQLTWGAFSVSKVASHTLPEVWGPRSLFKKKKTHMARDCQICQTCPHVLQNTSKIKV